MMVNSASQSNILPVKKRYRNYLRLYARGVLETTDISGENKEAVN